MPQPHGPCDDLKLSLGILANSVRNISTAKSIQKSRKQFASRQKRSQPLEPGSCLGYKSNTYTLQKNLSL